MKYTMMRNLKVLKYEYVALQLERSLSQRLNVMNKNGNRLRIVIKHINFIIDVLRLSATMIVLYTVKQLPSKSNKTRSLFLNLEQFAQPLSATNNNNNGKGKGKAIPLQTWTGPEGSRRLRLPDFKRIGT